MKKVTAALAVLLALTLTGCASGADDAGDERSAPVASETTATEETAQPSPDVTAAPITASPEADVTPPAQATSEGEFVAAAQNFMNSWGYWDFTNEQLLGAGLYACQTDEPSPLVVEGLDPEYSAEIVSLARSILCP